MTCSGCIGHGTDHRLMPTQSFSTCCSRSGSPAVGPPRSRTPSSPAGLRRKWGGPNGERDDLSLGAVTRRSWLAVSSDPAATVSGKYFYHQQLRATHPAANDPIAQEQLLGACAELSGTELP